MTSTLQIIEGSDTVIKVLQDGELCITREIEIRHECIEFVTILRLPFILSFIQKRVRLFRPHIHILIDIRVKVSNEHIFIRLVQGHVIDIRLELFLECFHLFSLARIHEVSTLLLNRLNITLFIIKQLHHVFTVIIRQFQGVHIRFEFRTVLCSLFFLTLNGKIGCLIDDILNAYVRRIQFT